MSRLADPWMLLLLPLLAVLAVWAWRRRRRRERMTVSSVEPMRGLGPTLRARLLTLPMLLMLCACALLIIAMARPQSAWRLHQRFTEGIDIMLVIDVSNSMQALDFNPNRLEKAKQVVKEFISGRENDRIGVVIFGQETFALCPLTRDYTALNRFVDRINFDLVSGDGTAIGMGLMNAVKRLQESEAESKVVILLTDGENNAGRVDPITAAEVASQLDIRVYTIGVGSVSGIVQMPNLNPIGPSTISVRANLNVKELTDMAQMTGGRFFHATDDQSLETIYAQIDKLETTEIEVQETHYFDDLGHLFIIPALALLILAFALENSWLRSFP